MTSNISSNAAATITVRAALFADLRKYLGKGQTGPVSVSLPAGSTVADLLAALGITDTDGVTAGRNNDQAPHDIVLNDGDEIVLFSPMEGG